MRAATAADVNDYLRQVTGREFTARDFRTWKASAIAASLLHAREMRESERGRRRALKQVVAKVAGTLGNTPTICRKYYIHADLLEDFLQGKIELPRDRASKAAARSSKTDEKIFSRYLRRWMRTRCRAGT